MYCYFFVITGILIPFFGTVFGSATVFFTKRNLEGRYQKYFCAFAAGVMTAAAIWSLLLPSLERSDTCIPAIAGTVLGILGFLFGDWFAEKTLSSHSSDSTSRQRLLNLAVTLHNIPEGMAVGVIFSEALFSDHRAMFGAFALSLGIAAQNFPEGAILSLPAAARNQTKCKAFRIGVWSGIVEPAGAVAALLLTRLITPLLPWILSFAAGAMIYVVIRDLIPESCGDREERMPCFFFGFGFVLMMLLDVCTG